MRSITQRFAELLHDPDTRQLPLPAAGRTLDRWRVLARVAAEDLALVKLYEGHTDALAIMAELGVPPQDRPEGSSWGTWAAEPPDARLEVRTEDGVPVLRGTKAWCSGAGLVSHALVTAWNAEGEQCLLEVSMAHPAVEIRPGNWNAVGMGRVPTPDVHFDGVPATPVGPPGAYTTRPGFWHGGCGIAACWYGGCLPLAALLRTAVEKRNDPHAAAHLGAIDLALRSLRALLIEAAGWIDAHPDEDAAEVALRVRGAADRTAAVVLDRFGRAVGAGPMCRDAEIAQRVADLPVFIRQTHADRDLAELGRSVAGRSDDSEWSL